MDAQIFEFSDKELIDLLVARLTRENRLPFDAVVCSVSAEPTKGWGQKGFKVSLRVENAAIPFPQQQEMK